MTKLVLPPQVVYAAVAVGVLAFLYWKGGQVLDAAGAAVKKAGAGVNPLNRDNVFYSGANALGAALGGDESFSVGSKLYDWTHPGG